MPEYHCRQCSTTHSLKDGCCLDCGSDEVSIMTTPAFITAVNELLRRADQLNVSQHFFNYIGRQDSGPIAAVREQAEVVRKLLEKS